MLKFGKQVVRQTIRVKQAHIPGAYQVVNKAVQQGLQPI